MKTSRAPARVAFALIAFALSACTSVGPATVPRDRIDYGTAIGDSWKQQTLLNIVKLRYGDMPIFLEIAQVIAGYQVEGTISAGVKRRQQHGRSCRTLHVGRKHPRPRQIHRSPDPDLRASHGK